MFYTKKKEKIYIEFKNNGLVQYTKKANFKSIREYSSNNLFLESSRVSSHFDQNKNSQKGDYITNYFYTFYISVNHKFGSLNRVKDKKVKDQFTYFGRFQFISIFQSNIITSEQVDKAFIEKNISEVHVKSNSAISRYCNNFVIYNLLIKYK